MTASESAQVEPGAVAGCPLPNCGSLVEVRRSLVRRKLPSGSPGLTSVSPRTVPNRLAAGAFTTAPYGCPTRLGPPSTEGELLEWQLICPTPQLIWNKLPLMLEKVGDSFGQVRGPWRQAPCAQKLAAPQSASTAHCAAGTPPRQPQAKSATMAARSGTARILTQRLSARQHDGEHRHAEARAVGRHDPPGPSAAPHLRARARPPR